MKKRTNSNNNTHRHHHLHHQSDGLLFVTHRLLVARLLSLNLIESGTRVLLLPFERGAAAPMTPASRRLSLAQRPINLRFDKDWENNRGSHRGDFCYF